MTFCESVDFVLFEIKADKYYKVTARRWEMEMFRQLAELIDNLVKEGRLDTEMQNSQPNLSQSQEDTVNTLFKQRKTSVKKFSGQYYRFNANPEKNECRPATDKNGKCLLHDFLTVLEELCKKDTNFDNFLKKIQDDNFAENDDDDEGYMNNKFFNKLLLQIFNLYTRNKYYYYALITIVM